MTLDERARRLFGGVPVREATAADAAMMFRIDNALEWSRSATPGGEAAAFIRILMSHGYKIVPIARP
jgi:hypothetical protein